jgi:hypothetical protein
LPLFATGNVKWFTTSAQIGHRVLACPGNPDPCDTKAYCPEGNELSTMSRRRKRYDRDEFVAKLRDAEGVLNAGKHVAAAL